MAFADCDRHVDLTHSSHLGSTRTPRPMLDLRHDVRIVSENVFIEIELQDRRSSSRRATGPGRDDLLPRPGRRPSRRDGTTVIPPDAPHA
jgi:hypothetical protein